MHPMVNFLRKELKKASDPERAAPMKAYMKNLQVFYGVPKPLRRRILHSARKQFNISSFKEYETVIKELWSGDFREELYCAVDIAMHYKVFRTDKAMKLYTAMLKSADNWDTVDAIASHLVGELVMNNRKHETLLKKWSRSKNMWLRRTSLLAHLRHKHHTNIRQLEDTILLLIDENEFFIQKAIGWVLRQYAYTDPKWVKQFVLKNSSCMSNLAKREAMRHFNI